MLQNSLFSSPDPIWMSAFTFKAKGPISLSENCVFDATAESGPVVTGGEWPSRGCEFESRHRTLYGSYSNFLKLLSYYCGEICSFQKSPNLVTSVTRWLYYLHNIWPLTTIKIFPLIYKIYLRKLKISPNTKWNLSKKSKFLTSCKSGIILPNLITLVTLAVCLPAQG